MTLAKWVYQEDFWWICIQRGSTFAGIFAGMESFRKFVGYLSIYSIWSIISLMVLRFRGSLAVS